MGFCRNFILKTAAMKPVERLIRRSFIFSPIVKRFIAGDLLEDAFRATGPLCSKGFGVSLDYLGENTRTEAEATHAVSSYVDMLERIAASPMRDRMNISIKLTQCGLDIGEQYAEENFRRVLSAASESQTFVRVDMESSEYTEKTVAMIERVYPQFNNTGTVLQSYLRRTPDDARRMIRLGARVRIVKGAYLEPETLAYQEKSKVDDAFLEVAKMLLTEGNYPAIATHDQKIIETLKDFAAARNIEKSSFEWQMLYGIRRDLQSSLLAEGYNVRVYVPFGDQWYPYFTRRLAERPANLLFILRAMFKR